MESEELRKGIIDMNLLRKSADYREEICVQIYRDANLKNQIVKLVQNKGGSAEEAEDVFQEAITVFFKKAVLDPAFAPGDNVKGYIFGTARNLFYSSKRKEVKLTELHEVGSGEPIAESTEGYDHIEIARKVLTYATATCRQVLMYWAANFSMREIATLMNYKSEMMARKKKYECIQKLTKYFEHNPALADKIMGHD